MRTRTDRICTYSSSSPYSIEKIGYYSYLYSVNTKKKKTIKMIPKDTNLFIIHTSI